MENNNISIHRIGLLYKFYSPAIRLLLIISGTVLLGSYALSLYGVVMSRHYFNEGPFFLIYSMGAGIAGWVYMAGPFILPMVSNRALITTLPASWAEKSIFIFSWIFVVYPLYLAILWYGAVGICSFFTDAASVNTAMMAHMSEVTGGLDVRTMAQGSRYFNVLSNMSMVAVATLIIVSVRRNRFILGVVGLLVCSFAASLVGIIVGVVVLLNSKFMEAAVAGAATPEAFAQNLLDEIAGAFPYVGIFSGLVLIVCIVLTVRKIRIRQC